VQCLQAFVHSKDGRAFTAAQGAHSCKQPDRAHGAMTDCHNNYRNGIVFPGSVQGHPGQSLPFSSSTSRQPSSLLLYMPIYRRA
jgi:hypothetical protein